MAGGPQGDRIADRMDLRVTKTVPPLREEFCCLVVRLTGQDVEKLGINREEILVVLSQFTVPVNPSLCRSSGRHGELLACR